VLRDALGDSESFLTQVPVILTNDNGTPCPQCHLSKLLRTCSSKIISMIDLCTILGTLVLRASRGSKSIWGLHSASSRKGFDVIEWYVYQLLTSNIEWNRVSSYEDCYFNYQL